MLQTIIGAILLVFAVFLIAAVLLQQGKSYNLGTISGGAETFFGKERGKTIDKILSKLTTVVAIVFVLMVLALYIFQ